MWKYFLNNLKICISMEMLNFRQQSKSHVNLHVNQYKITVLEDKALKSQNLLLQS